MRALVHGLGVAGLATVAALVRRGHEAIVVDDDADRGRQAAADLGVDWIPVDGVAGLGGIDVYCPAPGIPEAHPVIADIRRRRIEICGELELAYRWEQERRGGPRPMLAVTGTDGKTSTTLLATEMVRAGGRRVVAAGNTDVPLVEAIDADVDCFVVECTSFRLFSCSSFRAEAAAWLNLAPDHLDWHRSLDSYVAAKAQIFDLQRDSDVAIGSIDDPIVRRHLETAPARRIGFGRDAGDYREEHGALVGPAGGIIAIEEMSRSLPHDRLNALAAAALVLEADLARPADLATTLRSWRAPSHRIEFVVDDEGVRWFDDSKATTPHAVVAALQGFESVVLIAGGRNKGLDLAPLGAEAGRIRAVVAIGEAADEVRRVLAAVPEAVTARSMGEAVEQARRLAQPGDVVLLSPACASFDWYPEGGYAARGDDYARCVRELVRHPRSEED